MKRLSLIICTHNPKRDYLDRVLGALAAQTLPTAQWELLRIDNASDDRLALQGALSWHPRARLIREDTLGLTAARLRGIDESDGDVLVYVDDDNLLAPDYLHTAVGLFESHPFLGTIGPGVLEPEFAVEPPPRLEPYLPLLALRSSWQAHWSNNPTDRASVPWGAGLCVTRAVARAYQQLVEQLDTEAPLDRRGQRLFGNGDVAFSWAAAQIGKGFGVFPQLRATHLIRAERLTPSYLLRLVHDSTFSNAVSDYLVLGIAPGSASQRWKEVLRILLRALRRGPFALRMDWARLRGTDRARALIEQRRLQPLLTRPLKETPGRSQVSLTPSGGLTRSGRSGGTNWWH
jgi:glycosyltransferase involved in cell wall biosynthesis